MNGLKLAILLAALLLAGCLGAEQLQETQAGFFSNGNFSFEYPGYMVADYGSVERLNAQDSSGNETPEGKYLLLLRGEDSPDGPSVIYVYSEEGYLAEFFTAEGITGTKEYLAGTADGKEFETLAMEELSAEPLSVRETNASSWYLARALNTTGLETARTACKTHYVNVNVYGLPNAKLKQAMESLIASFKCLERIRQVESEAGSLKEHGMLDGLPDARFEEILKAINESRIKSTADIMVAANKASLHENNVSKPVLLDHYARIFRQMAALDPEFTFENFNATWILERDYLGNDTPAVLVSFTSGGNDYQQVNEYGQYIAVNYQAYEIANRALADKSATRRFYGISLDESDYAGIASLTAAQADYLHNSRLSVSYYENQTPSTKEIGNFTSMLRRVGLFNWLSEEEYAQAVSGIVRKPVQNKLDLFLAFPNTTIGYDYEEGLYNGPHPYASLTAELAGISRGEFNPTQISDNYSYLRGNRTEYSSATNFSFTYAGKHYERTVSGEWMDRSFAALINQALEAENLTTGRYYFLYYGESLVFLNSTQHAELLHDGLELEKAAYYPEEKGVKE